jgi:hypothetical protein
MKTNGFRPIIIRGVLLILLSLYFLVVFAQKSPNLVSFDVSYKAENISLQWLLSPSNNLSSVIIEKKLSDSSFQAIAQFWVNFEGNTERSFHFIDKKTKTKKAEYRLKLVTDKGEVQYSDIVRSQTVSIQKGAQKSVRQNSFLTINNSRLNNINTDNLKSLLLLQLQEREVNYL